ncbi:transposase [Nitrosomonas mobilis]|uniref:transposase n=1 Tax=Nitrosomonas mobilis TaxID=51642 RepID=UPI002480E4F2|nr:transposase [Nitrosomonas mobilis]
MRQRPRYYHAQLVKDYLANSKIELVFLLSCARNLNLIERFWKFFKKTVLYGHYYETFSQFKTACDNFFTGLD